MLINKEIILYGAGAQGDISFLNATNMNIPVKAFVDQRVYKKILYRGVKVLQPETAYNELNKWEWIITVGDKVENGAIHKILTDKNIVSYRSLEDYCVGQIDYDTSIVQYGDQGYSFSLAEKYLVKNPLVYSFGIGGNWSFEKELNDRFGGEVYMFDPSPNVVKKMESAKLPEGLFFEAIGLSNTDKLKRFHLPNQNIGEDYSELDCPWTKQESIKLQTHRLSTIMNNKGHFRLNLLKMDIEGSEFLALPDILKSGILIDQLCIETHARVFPNSVEVMKDLKKLLNDNDFLMVCNTLYEQTYLRKGMIR